MTIQQELSSHRQRYLKDPQAVAFEVADMFVQLQLFPVFRKLNKLYPATKLLKLNVKLSTQNSQKVFILFGSLSQGQYDFTDLTAKEVLEAALEKDIKDFYNKKLFKNHAVAVTQGERKDDFIFQLELLDENESDN